MIQHNQLFTIGLAVYILFFFSATMAFGKTVTFEKEYTYQASDIDSKVSSRTIALEQVKRALLEQLGTYLISETEVKNFTMTKDQITTLAAGIVSAEVIDEKWDGRTYYLKAKISADPNEVASSLDILKTDVQKHKELEESKKKAVEAIREVERLKKELELVKLDTKKQREYANAINDLSATDWFDKGKAFIQSEDYRDAVEAFSKSVKLNPKTAAAYNNRGVVYAKLENHRQALNDFNKAIGLNPKDAMPYNNRGLAYSALGSHQQAISDFNKAIKLDPKYVGAYINRGLAYWTLRKHQQAIDNYNKAIELKPTYADVYYLRGIAYDELENTSMAIKNQKKAAQLGNADAQAYLTSRGISWQ